MRVFAILGGSLVLLYLVYVALIGLNQRRLLYFPSHDANRSPLELWIVGEQIIGYARTRPHPRTVWLMTHGNGGQANQRAYVLAHLASDDALYVLEYPGYGLRAGEPSRTTFDAAAVEAYDALRAAFPQTPIGVIGESIGSGPASFLATLPRPPDKLVLIVPFDTLASVAAEQMPLVPARLLLLDRWDNVAALRNYAGPVDIFGARHDRIIPVAHAQRLAAVVPRARFVLLDCGHNDWSAEAGVRIER